LVGLALDGIFSFTEIPLRMASFLGALTIAASSLFVLYAAYARIVLQQSPQGFTAIIAILVFVSGVQLLFLGVIGEYVGRIYNEVKNRPKYVLERTIRRDR
jgi:dolichol-phosphate mannosyltransferase